MDAAFEFLLCCRREVALVAIELCERRLVAGHDLLHRRYLVFRHWWVRLWYECLRQLCVGQHARVVGVVGCENLADFFR